MPIWKKYITSQVKNQEKFYVTRTMDKEGEVVRK